MVWISRINQRELLEYITLGEVKKLNLFGILQWKFQAQCYVPKFLLFVVFQAGTSGEDINGKATLNSQGTCLGWDSWADQHHQLARKNDLEEVSQELKKIK